MKRLKTFKGLKKGDWILWTLMMGTKYLSVVSENDGTWLKESAYWELKNDNKIKVKSMNYETDISDFDFKRRKVHKLNKKEIKKWKMEITLSEL